jgi:hydroxymethylbilane synthase
MRPVKIASRASKLALTQANYIRNLLIELCPELEITIAKISTKGDRDKSDFLYKSESVGFFTSEVENAILQRGADLAVHSLKDLPTCETAGLVVAAMPQRQSVADALVAGGEISSISDLPRGATVGTSSLRRIAQLHQMRDDLNCVGLRGNVETRVGKVFSGRIDAAIVACAGLNRLGMADKVSVILPPDEFIPAPAQGALAVQIRSDDMELAELVGKIDNRHCRITAQAERRVLSIMQGGCSIPLGVYSTIQAETITIIAMISDIQGRNYIRRSKSAPIDKAKTCAEQLAEELLSAGGRQILEQIRDDKKQQ